MHSGKGRYGVVLRFHLGCIALISWSLCFFICCGLGPVRAADFRVNSGEDLPDLDPGNGLCVAYLIFVPPIFFPVAQCTLRAAIQEANALPGGDVIELGAREYRLALGGAGEDAAASGDLDITGPVTLVGAGSEATVINGSQLDRVLDIHGAGTAVVLQNLRITGGRVAGAGGGIRNGGRLSMQDVQLQGNRADSGGGLHSQGSCVADLSIVIGNSAREGGGISSGQGGTLVVSRSAIVLNEAGRGGGVASLGSGRFVNVTVSGNDAAETGGGIWNGGVLSSVHVTVHDNAGASGGGLANTGAAALVNTILSGNRPDGCDGRAANSLGGNLVGSMDCLQGGGAAGDRVSGAPKLGPLNDDSGGIPAHRIWYDSPAVNIGVDLAAEGIVTDQAGNRRPRGPAYDSGAMEAPLPVPPLLAPMLLR